MDVKVIGYHKNIGNSDFLPMISVLLPNN